MATTIDRPVYFEGQILGASDLQRSLEYARDENARHERYLHSWGIADGLDVKKQGNDFVLQPGFAIDSSGAPIVVAETMALDKQQLREEALLSGSDSGFFPVFIARTEEDGDSEQAIGSCTGGGATRRAESFAIQFRRIATGWDENQSSPTVAAGPEDALQSSRVVLIGFVKWSEKNGGAIVDFQRSFENFLPRYAGVRADDVVARGGLLTLRSRAPATIDAPVVVVDHHNPKQTFVLGLDDGTGQINELFSIDAKGNVTVKGDIKADGTLTGEVKGGDVLIESGTATDGMVVPLPVGINEKQVEDGSIVLHIQVSPRIDWAKRPAPGWGPFTLECEVDSKRRISALTRWLNLAGGPIEFDVPDAVDYLVTAKVAAGGKS